MSAREHIPLAPSVTGSVISSTDPTLPLPRAVVGGSVMLGAGTHVIRWTASDGPNSSFVDQTVTTRPGFYATQSIDVRDRSKVRQQSGALASILNSGTGTTALGVQSQVADILSRGPVTIAPQATVSGFIRSMGTISPLMHPGVVGPVQQNVTPAIVFPPPLVLTATFAATTTDITLGQGATRTISPGNYNHITVNQNAVLTMNAGQYFITELTLESGSRVNVSQVGTASRINVKTRMAMRGDIVVSPTAAGFQFAYFGTEFCALERPFIGTLYAPNSSLALGPPAGNQTFQGQFYLKTVEIRPDMNIVCRGDL